MSIKTIDAELAKYAFFCAADYLDKNKQAVNNLNVFPVPDGDTGTNMSLTIMAAVKEVKMLEKPTVSSIADAISKGALKGARGNSGVILSQIFRGFCNGLKGVEIVDIQILANAFELAVETAYKAVMKPVEGTILTVAREMGENAQAIAKKTTDINSFLEQMIAIGKKALDRTPEMLPVLKEAGVVDAGGMGLLYIIMGVKAGVTGEINSEEITIDIETPSMQMETVAGHDGEITFGYCTEFIIQNVDPSKNEAVVNDLKPKLEELGDSIVVVGDMDIVKVHVHTNNPGTAIQYGLNHGDLTAMKIDNMREQHRTIIAMEKKPVGVLAVSMGEGIGNIFKELEVDYVIKGGQTMNPSVEDILNGVKQANAEEVYVLPNNSNIILSAQHAAEISEIPIHVIPTKSIPQGMAAMLVLNRDSDSETNIEAMTEAAKEVSTGQVTFAVRDTEMNGHDIKEGDIIGVIDKEIKAVSATVEETTTKMIGLLVEDEKEVVTVFYGEDVTEEKALALADQIEEKYPDIELEMLPGGQPIYYYIISAE